MRFPAVGLALSFALPLAACGEGQPRPVPVADDEDSTSAPHVDEAQPRSTLADSSERTGISSFRMLGRDDSGCIRTASVTRRFSPAFLDSEQGEDSRQPERLLLTESVELEQTEQRPGVCAYEDGGMQGKLTVAAAPFDERAVGRPIWSLEVRSYLGINPAGEPWPVWPAAEHPAFYRVTYANVGFYHTLRTGKLLFTSSHELLRVDIADTPFGQRFIAFHDGRASPPPPEAGCDEEADRLGECDDRLVGVLQYGDDSSVFERLILVADHPLEYESARMALVIDGQESTRSWTALPRTGAIDRRQIGGFGIVVELYPSQSRIAPDRIEIPVQADAFAVAAARLPAGVRIRR